MHVFSFIFLQIWLCERSRYSPHRILPFILPFSVLSFILLPLSCLPLTFRLLFLSFPSFLPFLPFPYSSFPSLLFTSYHVFFHFVFSYLPALSSSLIILYASLRSLPLSSLFLLFASSCFLSLSLNYLLFLPFLSPFAPTFLVRLFVFSFPVFHSPR